jgi:T-complex protein 1 subunit eta
MSSKLIHSQKPFFSSMVVDAVMTLDQDELDESLIGVKKVPGGGMQVRARNDRERSPAPAPYPLLETSQDSLLIKGVAFKKTFSYAGFEQQPKSFVNPKVLCLNVELELKAEKDNAEVRVNEVSVR